MPYKLMFTFIIILGSVVSSYFLYKNGLFTRHMMVSFMQRSFFWKNKGWAKFGFCHGYIKKILYIKESRDYRFTFNAGITKGYVCAEIQECTVMFRYIKSRRYGLLRQWHKVLSHIKV